MSGPEAFREKPIQIRGDIIDPETATPEELMEFGKKYSYPYVFEKGQARQVVEEAERILAEHAEHPNDEMEKKQ